ncbi:MAG: Calx-beta domain-containing protein, partial [Opitutales bacterium]
MHFFPHPFRKAHRHLALLVAAAPMASLAQETVTDVYFVQNRQFVSEQDGTLDVTVELSQVAFAEVVVPFRIADASTATRGSEDDESGDYFIAEDSSENDGNGILFDPATGTGSFTFQSGVRRLSLPVRLRDDTLDSSDENEALEETIRFEMDTDGVTIARPVVPTTHTIVIQDNDTVDARFPYHAYFESTYFRVDEGDEVTIPVRLRGPGGVSRTLRWEYHFGSGEGQASSSDVNIGDDPSGTVGGSARTFDIVVDTAGDLEEEPDETFQLSLAALFETDAPDNTYVIDEDERATILIVDNDPSEVGEMQQIEWYVDDTLVKTTTPDAVRAPLSSDFTFDTDFDTISNDQDGQRPAQQDFEIRAVGRDTQDGTNAVVWTVTVNDI